MEVDDDLLLPCVWHQVDSSHHNIAMLRMPAGPEQNLPSDRIVTSCFISFLLHLALQGCITISTVIMQSGMVEVDAQECFVLAISMQACIMT
jgi:hypothetical protein